MTRLEELKAAYDATAYAYVDARDAALDACAWPGSAVTLSAYEAGLTATDAAWDAADAAYEADKAAYEAELNKTKETNK